MIRNFLFHRVSPNRDVLWDPMDIKLFDKCIKYISSKYELEQFEELFSSGNLFSNKNYATIMFDDGYKDNIEYAADILQKYNCKASFYVVTDCIDKNTLTWTHILEYTFQNTNVDSLVIDFDFLPSEFLTNSLHNQEIRIQYLRKVKPFLKTLPHSQRDLFIKRVKTTYSDVELPLLMMNWNDISQLKNAGHYIGSHTVSHAMLGTINDEEAIKFELLDSAKKIEHKLGYLPISISYPVGSYNQTTIKLSKEVGYKIGLAVKQNNFYPLLEDIFEVPRIELYNEPWWKTRLRITNTLENIKTFIRYK